MTKPIAAEEEKKQPVIEIVKIPLAGGLSKKITWEMYPLGNGTAEKAVEHFEAKYKVKPTKAWQWLHYLYIPVPGQKIIGASMMKNLFNKFQATKVLVVMAMGLTYYLAVPPEHQIFKFIALVCLMAVFGELCRQGGVDESGGKAAG